MIVLVWKCLVLCLSACDYHVWERVAVTLLFSQSGGAAVCFPKSLCGLLTQPAVHLLVQWSRGHSEVGVTTVTPSVRHSRDFQARECPQTQPQTPITAEVYGAATSVSEKRPYCMFPLFVSNTRLVLSLTCFWQVAGFLVVAVECGWQLFLIHCDMKWVKNKGWNQEVFGSRMHLTVLVM